MMYILKVQSITKNKFEKGKSEKKLNFWESMSVDESERNDALIYSADEGYALIRYTLKVKFVGLDGFDVKCLIRQKLIRQINLRGFGLSG